MVCSVGKQFKRTYQEDAGCVVAAAKRVAVVLSRPPAPHPVREKVGGLHVLSTG